MRTSLLAVAAFALMLTACTKASPSGSCANGAAYCFTPSSAESAISAAFASVKDGDVISFAAGTYKFNNQLALGSASNVTVEGAGPQTIFDFSKQQAAEDSIFAQSPAAGLTFRSFAVQDSPGNAIKVLGVKGLTFDSLTVTWTAPDAHTHGAYGLYPVQSSNVTIENCKVSGASDSGIYVGQSQNVVVQKNECFQNVSGIEIENTYGADVHDNKSHDNTAGILVFGLPGLQQEGGHTVRVFSNVIENNNTKNFAAKGDIVSIVPAGTGFFVMACSDVEVYGNTFTGNGTVGTAVISYFVTQLPVGDPKYYPYSSGVYFHGNTFTGNGTAPDLTSQLGLLVDTGFNVFPGQHTPDVVYDGIVGCPLGAASDAGIGGSDAGQDAGGCGLPPKVVGPSSNPMNVCVKEPNASGICNFHLDQLNATSSNLGQIADCDAGYLACSLPPLSGVPPFGGTNPVMRALALGGAFLVAAALAGACSHGSSGPTCTLPGNGGVDGPSSFPATLDSFCMVSIKNAQVVPHDETLVPYDLNTPLFSDYAVKFRTLWMPKGTHATYAASGRFELPPGTVITKSFGFPADFRQGKAPAGNGANVAGVANVKWVETRVLVNTPKHGWTGASYTWNDAQTEATLLLGGEIVSVIFIDTGGTTQNAHYLVPSQAQCKECHANDGTMTTLGPSAAQLNRSYAYPGGKTENQLAHWSAVGVLGGAPSPQEAPALPVWDDPTTGDVQSRARAYLDANCSYCHNGQGEARTTGLLLSYASTDPASGNPSAYGVCKSPVAAGKASSTDQYDIVPGHPELSIVPYRMGASGPSIAMPQLGRSIAHAEAVALISEWIGGLAGSCP